MDHLRATLVLQPVDPVCSPNNSNHFVRNKARAPSSANYLLLVIHIVSVNLTRTAHLC